MLSQFWFCYLLCIDFEFDFNSQLLDASRIECNTKFPFNTEVQSTPCTLLPLEKNVMKGHKMSWYSSAFSLSLVRSLQYPHLQWGECRMIPREMTNSSDNASTRSQCYGCMTSSDISVLNCRMIDDFGNAHTHNRTAQWRTIASGILETNGATTQWLQSQGTLGIVPIPIANQKESESTNVANSCHAKNFVLWCDSSGPQLNQASLVQAAHLKDSIKLLGRVGSLAALARHIQRQSRK